MLSEKCPVVDRTVDTVQTSYLFQYITLAKRDQFGMIKGTDHFSSGHRCQSFDAIKIGMFNGRNVMGRKERFRIIVNQLSIDKDVASMCDNFVNFLFHFLFFGTFNVGHFG